MEIALLMHDMDYFRKTVHNVKVIPYAFLQDIWQVDKKERKYKHYLTCINDFVDKSSYKVNKIEFNTVRIIQRRNKSNSKYYRKLSPTQDNELDVHYDNIQGLITNQPLTRYQVVEEFIESLHKPRGKQFFFL